MTSQVQKGGSVFDFKDHDKSDLDLLYLPKEALTTRERPPISKATFTRFVDVQRTDAYSKKKNTLTEPSVVNSLCKRLVYNSSQQHKYIDIMNHESLHTYSQVVEEMEKWEKKKSDHLKIIKRNPFGAIDIGDEGMSKSIDSDRMVQKGPVNIGGKLNPVAGIISNFFSDEERRSHIQVYKMAWYPTTESAVKNVECLEGASTVLIDKKAYILGGYSNDTSRMFFVYNVDEDKFYPMECKGFRPHCIMYHTTVALNNTIYVFGGDVFMGVANSKMTSNDIWSIDTISHEWKRIKTLKSVEPRKHHAACDFGTFMLVSGGLAEDSTTPFKDFHAFSIESEEWFKISDQVEWAGLSNHTMTPVYNNKVKNLYSKSTAGNKNKIDTTDVGCSDC
jgi:hypothetical protein